MKVNEEKVIVISRKTVYVISIIIFFLAILGLCTTWYYLKNQQAKSTKQSGITNNDFILTSDAGEDGGTLPTEYTCDGTSSSPQLSWANPPSSTKEYAVMMTTIPVDGVMKWSWVMYNIPGSINNLSKNTTGIGKLGAYKASSPQIYHPPCSQGDGLNKYTFTVYALSESPTLPLNQAEVTGEVLTKAISGITLDSATLNLYHQRTKQEIDNK